MDKNELSIYNEFGTKLLPGTNQNYPTRMDWPFQKQVDVELELDNIPDSMADLLGL